MNDHTSRPVPRPDTRALAARYRAFAADQAAGSSPSLERWAEAVAEDSGLLALLAPLPYDKQQPNLVFAAARWHGARPGDPDSLRALLTTRWATVEATIHARATQTNEAARCAAILLGLRLVPGPVALLELGAAAGLCLIPDRYSYTFGDGARLDPASGAATVSIDVRLQGGLTPPEVMPDIAWRAGLDLNPLDSSDPDILAWLQTLVWPEHEARRTRLTAAAALAAEHRVHVSAGELRTGLEALAATAPSDATLVVTHSATLAYLDEPARREAAERIANLGARRISFEARGVDPTVPPLPLPLTPDTLFIAALDGTPYAIGDGHGTVLTHP
ncbi:hypothetical protein SNE510_58790 [Streptomyces sp. NE5-10]|uniref:DUF2332 domain-containing protein n=1 Tax=Streptomyces sp. NE5-10 TaxID=2759674 RepID=UPI001908E417|nr:DUF2332 domain-containing protein [Streptomyces sp. NE5-10]GHJ96360.1 hypothetical protein SNE510_58790 [Streptomyces sp. NE5-10]